MLTITTASPLPNGVTNTPYSLTMTGAGGVQPYTWSSVDLPSRLAISTGGLISGTPLNAGTLTTHITLLDSSSPPVQITKALVITIVPILNLDTASLPGGMVGTAYSATLAASGGVPAYTWSAAGPSHGPDHQLQRNHQRHSDGHRLVQRHRHRN